MMVPIALEETHIAQWSNAPVTRRDLEIEHADKRRSKLQNGKALGLDLAPGNSNLRFGLSMLQRLANVLRMDTRHHSAL